MAQLSSNVGGAPIFVSPGESGGFGYTTSAAGTGTLTFTPLGDGLPGSGSTVMNISTVDAGGHPVTMDIPVSNEAPTQVDVPYGVDGSLGSGQVTIGNVPQLGADGNILPNLPMNVPGVKEATSITNDALQTHTVLTQKSFAVTMNGNPKKMKDKPATCDAKCQAEKAKAVEHLDQSFGSPGMGP